AERAGHGFDMELSAPTSPEPQDEGAARAMLKSRSSLFNLSDRAGAPVVTIEGDETPLLGSNALDADETPLAMGGLADSEQDLPLKKLPPKKKIEVLDDQPDFDERSGEDFRGPALVSDAFELEIPSAMMRPPPAAAPAPKNGRRSSPPEPER